VLPDAASSKSPGFTRFTAWSLVRLLLMMLFGFLLIWGVRVLTDRMLPSGSFRGGAVETGQFAMPYRIAQLLGFMAVTMWASSYGIAARAWSHGQVRRAKVQMFRVGRLGMAAMMLAAVALLWGRGVLEWMLPAYADSIDALLPQMLALFLAYGLLTFLSSYSDLRELPQRGAAMWGIAAAAQAAAILAGWSMRFSMDPKEYMLLATTAGLAGGVLLVGPVILWPLRFAATGVPLAAMGVAAISLFAPGWVVDWIAGPALLGAVAFLWMAGLLIRTVDRRALRRWKAARTTLRATARQGPVRAE
jgi:hypothetical protein